MDKDIVVNTIAPIPCRVFYADAKSQREICTVGIDKIGEEYIEMQATAHAYCNDTTDATKKYHLAEELTDIITAATSFLDALDYDEEDRAKLIARVDEKNWRRGYHE